jgi:proton-dependent oligopeptide transporter, POT family
MTTAKYFIIGNRSIKYEISIVATGLICYILPDSLYKTNKVNKMSEIPVSASGHGKGFFGHPWGLSTLFFTEMWERFSYYGMRALLILYMTTELSKGGLGWDTKYAGFIYGLYTSSVYFLPLIGGLIADRLIGAKMSTLIGGIVIALGHFLLAFSSIGFFYAGLVTVAVGTGFLKSNISKMVGDLYSEEDKRRDAGFSIFYMGINLGAFLAPLITGALAVYNWHWGFAAAGVGMVFGVIQYVIGWKNLKGIGDVPAKIEGGSDVGFLALMVGLIVVTVLAVYFLGIGYLMPTVLVAGIIAVLSSAVKDKIGFEDWKRVGAIGLLFLFATIFWMAFEQAGSSLNLFAEQMTSRAVGSGWEFPSAWLQSVNSIFLILLAPVFAWVWIKMADRQPSDPTKFAIGLFFAGLGFVVLAYASSIAGGGKVSWLWLVAVYLCHTIGELCLSPVGLSSMTKLAPVKMAGLMMGVWFLSLSIGSYIGGLIAGEFKPEPDVLYGLFSKVAMVAIGAAVVLLVLVPLFKKLTQKEAA